MKKILFILSILFVIFSFIPSFYELYHAKDLPAERTFVLEHNYMFDYNFYLSRIREGQEGRWLVTEKYYNQPHPSSLFQIFYLYLGKIGGILSLDPLTIYHLSRFILGFILLYLTALYSSKIFSGFWRIIAFLFAVTCGSWPILLKTHPSVLLGIPMRAATYMGWWSAIDSLQRITFIPHVLLGQIFMLLFVWRLGGEGSKLLTPKNSYLVARSTSSPPMGESTGQESLRLLGWGCLGLIIGIIFPPTLLVVYAVFGVLSVIELLQSKSPKPACLPAQASAGRLPKLLRKWMPRIVFILFSFPAFIYLQVMFQIWPWKALALFDVQHRIPLPYKEYALALGPVLIFGAIGLIVSLFKKESRLFPSVSWVIAVILLILVFENVPQQSPLRFTEAAINIPLGILSCYFFQFLWQKSNKLKKSLATASQFFISLTMISVILLGLGVMLSMVLWLTDQAFAKRTGGWIVPSGAQLAYPLKDFMEGVYFLRDKTDKEEVVLAYETSSNFIPAYAGNFVYFGHANTPNEGEKKKKAADFFSGTMNIDEVKKFLTNENISYIYFGPQEREVGRVDNLQTVYPFLKSIYTNPRVTVYRVL